MAIVDDFDAIAKRLRELQSAAPKSADQIAELERWRDLARETARAYLESRKRELAGSVLRKQASLSVRTVAAGKPAAL